MQPRAVALSQREREGQHQSLGKEPSMWEGWAGVACGESG
jgi:hypothetical protein